MSKEMERGWERPLGIGAAGRCAKPPTSSETERLRPGIWRGERHQADGALLDSVSTWARQTARTDQRLTALPTRPFNNVVARENTTPAAESSEKAFIGPSP